MTTATTLRFGRTARAASSRRRPPAQFARTSKRFASSRGSAACATGSPMQERSAMSFAPSAVITSSTWRQPTNGRSSFCKRSKMGCTISAWMRCKTSLSTAEDGAKAPMPSVTGPRSSSFARFWSCTAAGSSINRVPSLKAKTETSGSAAVLSWGGAAAIGTPQRSKKDLENCCEDSISAAAREGPKVGTPAPRSSSARPSRSNVSWPTTARAMCRSLQKSLTSLKCGGVNGTSTGTNGAACEWPL
mmetsp:Transcript_102720/g.296950  ORF Transcript_102720/g.296950 Transcript_102720/m.296950 type:complete len:246 (+) Transcript_102720:2496-3233(+)